MHCNIFSSCNFGFLFVMGTDLFSINLDPLEILIQSRSNSFLLLTTLTKCPLPPFSSLINIPTIYSLVKLPGSLIFFVYLANFDVPFLASPPIPKETKKSSSKGGSSSSILNKISSLGTSISI